MLHSINLYRRHLRVEFVYSWHWLTVYIWIWANGWLRRICLPPLLYDAAYLQFLTMLAALAISDVSFILLGRFGFRFGSWRVLYHALFYAPVLCRVPQPSCGRLRHPYKIIPKQRPSLITTTEESMRRWEGFARAPSFKTPCYFSPCLAFKECDSHNDGSHPFAPSAAQQLTQALWQYE